MVSQTIKPARLALTYPTPQAKACGKCVRYVTNVQPQYNLNNSLEITMKNMSDLLPDLQGFLSALSAEQRTAYTHLEDQLKDSQSLLLLSIEGQKNLQATLESFSLRLQALETSSPHQIRAELQEMAKVANANVDTTYAAFAELQTLRQSYQSLWENSEEQRLRMDAFERRLRDIEQRM